MVGRRSCDIFRLMTARNKTWLTLLLCDSKLVCHPTLSVGGINRKAGTLGQLFLNYSHEWETDQALYLCSLLQFIN